MQPTSNPGKAGTKISWLDRAPIFFSGPQGRSRNKLRKRRPDKTPESPSPSPSPSIDDGSTASRKKKRGSVATWLHDPLGRSSRDAGKTVTGDPTEAVPTAASPGPEENRDPGKVEEGSQTVAAAPVPRILLNEPTDPHPTQQTFVVLTRNPVPTPHQQGPRPPARNSRSSLTLHHWMRNAAAVSDSDFIPVLPDVDNSDNNSDSGRRKTGGPVTAAAKRPPASGSSVPLPLFARLQTRVEPERGDLGELRRGAGRREDQRCENSDTAWQRSSSAGALAGSGSSDDWQGVNGAEVGNYSHPQASVDSPAGLPYSGPIGVSPREGNRYYAKPSQPPPPPQPKPKKAEESGGSVAIEHNIATRSPTWVVTQFAAGQPEAGSEDSSIGERTAQVRALLNVNPVSASDPTPSEPQGFGPGSGEQYRNGQPPSGYLGNVLHPLTQEQSFQSRDPCTNPTEDQDRASSACPPVISLAPEPKEIDDPDDPRGIMARHARDVEDAIRNLSEMTEEYKFGGSSIEVPSAADGRGGKRRTSGVYSIAHSSDVGWYSDVDDGPKAEEDGGRSLMEGDAGLANDAPFPAPDVVVVARDPPTSSRAGATVGGRQTDGTSLWERRTGSPLRGSPVTQLFDMLRTPSWDHHL
ncbi:hypothetical protein B0A55_11482 [Friedmanniomyces simplex]|uniref:Uncharacterized protein n=1 Tax=Friedmanniomyces simplex TaxID=329884 RepID=A0A4U0WHC6_9PEZI|nr:hypothetical protein B0A55_11482 [Friedmanniomyces simplex]